MASPVTARRFGDAKKPLYACITGNTRLLLLDITIAAYAGYSVYIMRSTLYILVYGCCLSQ